MASSTPFSPFYEPGAPPPPLPLLTAQTDLIDNPLRPLRLTNAEPLPRSGTARATTSAHPRLTKVTSSRCTSPPSDSSSDPNLSESGSDISELSDSDSSSDSGSADVKIPKPPGEAGRPGRGGYTLEEALDWNSKTFKKLKVRSPFHYSRF